MHEVTLSNGIKFMCSASQTILEAAKENSIAIEYSCRSGRCGVCLAQVTQGETIPLTAEESISKSELSSGKVLTCCRTPLTDIFLDIADLGAIGSLKTLTLPCKVDSIELLNDDVLEIILRLPPQSDFTFLPGQYLDLINGDLRRSYSIANAPRVDGRLELHIKKVENGLMSDALFSTTKKNDLFRIEGPLGTFSYRDDDEENIILIATGTGIAPIKALLESLSKDISQKKIFVIWGARFKKDIYFNLEHLTKNYQLLKVLSREQCDGFFYGYVQDAVLSLGLDLKKSSVYACGSESMIKDARDCFIRKGLASKRFHSDAFVSSS